MKHRLSYVRSFFPICLNTSDLQNEMILAEIMTFLFYCKIPFIFQDYDHMDPEPRFKEHSRGKQSKKGMCSLVVLQVIICVLAVLIICVCVSQTIPTIVDSEHAFLISLNPRLKGTGRAQEWLRSSRLPSSKIHSLNSLH